MASKHKRYDTSTHYTPNDHSFAFSPASAYGSTSSNRRRDGYSYNDGHGDKFRSYPSSSSSLLLPVPSSSSRQVGGGGGNKPTTYASSSSSSKWASPSSPRARAERSLQSYQRRRQVQKAVLGTPDDEVRERET